MEKNVIDSTLNTFITISIPKRLTSELIIFVSNIEHELYIPKHFKRVKSSLSQKNTNEFLLYNATKVELSIGKTIIQNVEEFMKLRSISDIELKEQNISVSHPESKSDYEEKLKVWPINYIPKKIPELTESEKQQYMTIVDKEVDFVKDDKSQVNNYAVLLDPSGNEILTKIDCVQRPGYPLDHAIIRLINKYSEDYLIKDKKRYLLTNLTLITHIEPCMMCSMALVHSRINRVIYTENNKNFMGSLNKELNINNLGVNHKYEVFQYDPAQKRFNYIN